MRIKVLLMFFIVGLAFLSFMNGASEPGTGLQVGDKAPKILHRLLDGPEFDSESLKGKMVLIDFWASYDAPSRVDNFRKKMILEKYRNSEFLNSEGFVIVSVSLDRFKTPLYKSIERDGLHDFFHVWDFNGTDSKLAITFDVGDEFTNYLIDGEGRIVERSVSLDNIEMTLDRLESTNRELFAAYRR